MSRRNRITIHGLLLEPTEAVIGQFRRVGTFFADEKPGVPFPNPDDHDYYSFISARKDSHCWAEETLYDGSGFDGVDGCKEYVITLV